MFLEEFQNLKVTDKINFQGTNFILERVQLFKNGNIEYQFGAEDCDVEYFCLIITKDPYGNHNVLNNGGTVFIEDDCIDEFDLNELWKY